MKCLQSFKRIQLGAKGLSTTPERSAFMGRVRRAGTEPELAVRRAFSDLGIRYTLQNRDLPGTPDLANRTRRFAIFVNGCYWHRHAGCKRSTTPKSNREFWEQKFIANVIRDRRVVRQLRAMGFRVAIIWECETKRDEHAASIISKLADTLDRDV